MSSTGPCANDTATLTLTVDAQQVTTSSGGTVYTCNGIFMDDGGTLGNYNDNQNYVFTICPDSAHLINIDFTAFDVDNSDYLKIYDGNTAAATLLGTYNNSNPLSGIIQASLANATGCLTFEFYADGSNNAAGWQATINCEDTASMDVDFVANLTTVCLGDTITFTDSTTNNPTSWNWDFGDGNSSTAQNPTHVYATAGTYDVKLVVTNGSNSDSITKTGYIMINAPPTVDLGNDTTSICQGDSVLLDAGAGHTSYLWSTGDTTQTIYASSSGSYSVTVGNGTPQLK